MTHNLTERQLRCLRLTAAGHTGKAIARRLDLHLSTVRYELDHTRSVLGAHNIAHGCALAVVHGIVTADHLGLKEDA